MTPGSHVAVLADRSDVGVEGRLLGLELRDTLIVLRSGPTSGFVFLFRVPVRENTIAEQVLKTGTGGLNLDSCRVGTGEDKGFWPITGRATTRNSMAGPMRAAETDTTVGRWPPNVLLVHAPGCRRAGTRRVPSGVAYRGRSGGKSSFGGRYKPLMPDMTYAEEDGLETASAYECEEGCPIGMLDELSGDRPPSFRRASTGYSSARNSMAGEMGHDGQPFGHHDSGGASRFYPQFENEEELLGWLHRLIGAGHIFRDYAA